VKFSAASRLIWPAKKFSGGGYGIQTSAVMAARRKMLYQNNGLLWRRTISLRQCSMVVCLYA